MGCRRYFAASRLEVLLDEDDSRSSSRVREHRSFLLVSQLHVAIQTLWSQCLFPRAEWTNRLDCLPVLFWSASTFSSASSSLSTCSTDTGTQLWLNDSAFTSLTVLEFVLSQPNKTSFPISLVSKQSGCSLTSLSVLDNWVFDFGWILLTVFTTSSNFWIQFFHPSILKKKVFGRGRWHKDFLVFDFSSFHPNNFRDTISWECVVKDDCVRSCLMELKSFLFSKLYIDPIHRVLMSSPLFLFVPCKTWRF